MQLFNHQWQQCNAVNNADTGQLDISGFDNGMIIDARQTCLSISMTTGLLEIVHTIVS